MNSALLRAGAVLRTTLGRTRSTWRHEASDGITVLSVRAHIGLVLATVSVALMLLVIDLALQAIFTPPAQAPRGQYMPEDRPWQTTQQPTEGGVGLGERLRTPVLSPNPT